MQNAADDEHVVSLDADEEQKEDDTEYDNENWQPDEDGRHTERRRQDRVEVRERSVADAVGAEVDELAELVETDVADPGAAQGVADPLRRGEDDDVDDKEAEREQRPAQTEAVSTASVDLHGSLWRHIFLSATATWSNIIQRNTYLPMSRLSGEVCETTSHAR